jgi:LysM repeat protein
MAGRSHAIQNARKGRLLAGLALLGLLLIDAPGAAALVQSARAVSYEVQAGDTLISIARRHGVDWRELARSNNLDDANLIRVGETIRIAELPEADPALPAQERAAQTSARRVVPMQPPADEVLIPQQRRTVLAEAPVLSAAIPIVVEGRRYPNVPVETTMSELLAIAPLALATSLSE